jgi:hypothetical protein
MSGGGYERVAQSDNGDNADAGSAGSASPAARTAAARGDQPVVSNGTAAPATQPRPWLGAVWASLFGGDEQAARTPAVRGGVPSMTDGVVRGLSIVHGAWRGGRDAVREIVLPTAFCTPAS